MSHGPIRIQIPKPAVSDTYDAGFVSLYFLVVFLLVTSIITVLMMMRINRMKTAVNLKRINELEAEEAAVCAFLKCELKNERLESGMYEANGVSFSVSLTHKGASVSIFSPIAEVMEVTIQEDRLYDYDVIRSETPA